MEGERDNQICSPTLLLLVHAGTCTEGNFQSVANQFIGERIPWRLTGERRAPGFLNKQKVYERVSSGVRGVLIVLSLDKSERGIAKATLSVRFSFVIG